MSFQNFLPYTTSGINDFSLTASEIIDQAADNIQVGSDGEELQAEEYYRFLNELNLLLREMQADGLHITTLRTGFLFLEAGKTQYILEDSEATTQYFETTTSADVVSPTTTIPLTDISNYEVGDRIGIYKNDANLFWSTVSSITPTVSPAGDVEIADAIDGDADEGCNVLNYRDVLPKADRVTKTLRRDNLTTDIPITQLSRDEYENLPFKNTTAGQVSQAYYWRAREGGQFFLWPPAQDSRQIFVFVYEKQIDDLKDPQDALDLDRMYLPVVVKMLAWRMCNRLGISNDVYSRVSQEAQLLYDKALTYDNEVTSFKISLQRNN